MNDDPADGMHVLVADHTIVVTKPGSKFSATYQKEENAPHLVLVHSWLGPNLTTPAVAEFLDLAWIAADAKARELGWIV